MLMEARREGQGVDDQRADDKVARLAVDGQVTGGQVQGAGELDL